MSRARKLARHRLVRWGVDDETLDTAILVVSELVTNAIVHAAGESVVCEVRLEDGKLRISVEDQGYGPTGPQLHRASPDEGGRGLLLVDAVCCSWGAHETAGYGPGRVVWAELPQRLERPC